MPKRRRVWAAWNYITSSTISKKAPICVTFWMNCLQKISPSFGPVLVTLNPTHRPAKHLTQGQWEFRHPLFSIESMEAQRLLSSIQNKRGISYAGAWTNFGFHEDGFSSGVRVAIQHLGARIPFEFKDADFLWQESLRMSWQTWFARLAIRAVLACCRFVKMAIFPLTIWWGLEIYVVGSIAHALNAAMTTFWFRHV